MNSPYLACLPAASILLTVVTIVLLSVRFLPVLWLTAVLAIIREPLPPD